MTDTSIDARSGNVPVPQDSPAHGPEATSDVATGTGPTRSPTAAVPDEPAVATSASTVAGDAACASARPAVGEDGWFWASDAPAEGARIEMRRRDDGGMDVRTSDDPGTVLSYTRSEWECWLDGVANHEFDHLAQES